MKSIHFFSAMVGAIAILGSACSSNSTTTSKGTGGSANPETGGTSGSGGAAGSGGTVGSGGTSSTGGQPSSGGVSGTGGRAGAGGAVGTGGAAGTGGTTSGTTSATGGRVGSGGRLGTGGEFATGGQPGSGGTSATGGRVGSGGAGAGGRQGTGGEGGAIDGGSAGAGGGGGASAGCGSANTTSPCSASPNKCSLEVNSKTRTYYVELPSNYNASTQYPVVFQFHPMGGSAEGSQTMYGTRSSLPNMIRISPQGLTSSGDGGTAGWANSNGEDIAFTKAMLADVQSKYCVDNSRIFSVGFSYGGMMSFAVGCEMSDVFRAIAPMSGALYSDFNCKGTGPHIAMWGSHGLSDNVVPIADGRAARDKIIQEDHCTTTTSSPDANGCVTYQGCDPGYDVTWCEFSGTHQIPSFGNSAFAAFFKTF